MIFPISIAVINKTNRNIHHCCGLVEAENEYEATGKAYKICYKVYPKHIYEKHHCITGNTSTIDPEQEEIIIRNIN